MPKYLFFDISQELLDVYRKVFTEYEILDKPFKTREIGSKLSYENNNIIMIADHPMDVRKMVKNQEADVYLSPANSWGWMDGGIDEIYKKIWPSIETIVKRKIKKISPYNAAYQRFSLPVKSAMIVKCPVETDEALLVAPTMTSPGTILNDTDNVYYAMYAALQVSKCFGDECIIAIPGLGTGVGGLSPEESAEQIACAIIDYAKGKSLDDIYPDKPIISDTILTYIVAPATR